jgi:hypothetical protein
MFYAAENASSWTAFIQQAEEVAWLAYPDTILNGIINNQNASTSGTLYCFIYERRIINAKIVEL